MLCDQEVGKCETVHMVSTTVDTHPWKPYGNTDFGIRNPVKIV